MTYSPREQYELSLHTLQSGIDRLEEEAARYPAIAFDPDYLDAMADARARLDVLIARLALEKVA